MWEWWAAATGVELGKLVLEQVLNLGKSALEDNAAIDLGAEKLIAAERGSEKIAVEIKSFSGASFINDLENAWGQFFFYARALGKKEPDRLLYLAVSRNIAETLFKEAGELLLEEPGFRLLVFDQIAQEVVSPSTQTKDYRSQRAEYGLLEILEYWIVDPLIGRITIGILDHEFYDLTEYQADQPMRSPILPSLELTVAQILAAKQ